MKRSIEFILNKSVYWIISFVTLLFSIVFFGSTHNLANINLGAQNNNIIIFIFALLFVIAMFGITKLLFSIIDKINNQKIIAITLFSIMTIGFILTLFVFNVRPMSDSFDGIDAAYYLSSHSKILANNTHAFYMGIYSNNYLFVIIFKYLFRLMSFLKINNVLAVFYSLNMFMLIFGVFIFWMICKTNININFANKLLCTFVINPIYYFLGLWIYSLSFSFPVMMLIIYISLKLYKEKKTRNQILYSIFLGGIITIGYMLRPTAIFPAIAMCYFLIKKIIQNGISKRLIRIIIIVPIAFILSFSVVKSISSKPFDRVSNNNLPVSWWLMMGSHGNGDLSTNYTAGEALKQKNKKAINRYCINRTVQFYKENGVSGNINLWAKKTIVTWSNAFSVASSRLFLTDNSKIYDYFFGDKTQLFRILLDANRFLLILVCIYEGIKIIVLRRNISNFLLLSYLIIFGGLVFYFIWEAKDVYSMPFIPFAQIIYVYGINELMKVDYSLQFKQKYGMMFGTFSFIICLAMLSILTEQVNVNHVRVSSLLNDRMSTPISYKNEIKQEFYSNKSFNNISFWTQLSGNKDLYSSYECMITDSNKNTIVKTIIAPQDIMENNLAVSFKTIKKPGKYTLKIKKINKEKSIIPFYSNNSYFIDSYRGTLSTDSREYHNDLRMAVTYNNVEPYLSKAKALVFIAVFILMLSTFFYDFTGNKYFQ